ncbi:hypothetical protein QAD02_008488 [Eretmocerus hayati]|uniref:Uncharacterized protein n=1 Tax=Eretmocerus hayati TaxID=131215 RepID=A0ACC2N7F8_9HYME|nr:hypothetical protein QAD02_008488 [Eretmocerus hayati]
MLYRPNHISEDGPVGVAVPVEGKKDQLVVGCGREILLVTWDGESNVTDPPIKKLASLDTDRTDTRVNDGKCDPAGRFWCGTMAIEVNCHIEPNRGALYLLDKELVLKTVHSPVSISNGLTWSPQRDVMYYIDSTEYQIWAFDYSNSTGSISKKRIVFDVKKNNLKGLPDGMTIDADGNLWIALFDGAAVIQVNPESGKLLRTIKLPAEKITSVAFGGPQLDVLYVTSAHVNMTAEQKEAKPESGSLFSIKGLGVRGLPPTDYKLSC